MASAMTSSSETAGKNR